MAYPTKTVLTSQATCGSKLSMTGLLRLGVAACICLPATVTAQDALPQGGQVAVGEAVIATPNDRTMNITQNSNSAVVNWNSFSIGSGSQVNIQQPSTNSVILNRVTGDTTSAIHGQLNANGSVHLVNPNGIFIGPNGAVTAQGFVGSTLDITDEDFVAGHLTYAGNGSSGTVSNSGVISIGSGGYAALLGGQIRNDGTVSVPLGRIGFASGERVTLDLSGDQFLQVAIPTENAGEGALIDNSGTASAQGGVVEMRAATARQAVRQAVNMSGVAEASSVSVRGGSIVLGGGSGGTVNVSGRVNAGSTKKRGGSVQITGKDIVLTGATIDASGKTGGGQIKIGGDFGGDWLLLNADTVSADTAAAISADALIHGSGGGVAIWSEFNTDFAGYVSTRGAGQGGNGGYIEISSRRELTYTGSIDARAPSGAWGTLLLDPTDINIDDNPQADALMASLESANVTLDTSGPGTDPGNLTIEMPINWTAATTLTLNANGDVVTYSPITAPNGALVVNAVYINLDETTVNSFSAFADEFYLRGVLTETGSGGSVDVGYFSYGSTTGGWVQTNATLSSFNAENFDIRFSNQIFLRAAGGTGTQANPYVIVDIYGLQGIGSGNLAANHFVLGNDIDASGTRLWGNSFNPLGFAPIYNFSGTLDGDRHAVSNLYSVSPNGEGGLSPIAMFYSISPAGVVTDLDVFDAYVLGSTGGLLAVTNEGTISNTRVSGQYFAEGDAFGVDAVGGLVGHNYGTISDSTANVAVYYDNSNTFFFGTGDTYVGGFVGVNEGTINRSHAAGGVDVVNIFDRAIYVGGFAGTEGLDLVPFTINDSYALGAVTVASSAPNFSTVNAGGFLGEINGAVNRSYSTGSVTVTGTATRNIGGFAASDATSGTQGGTNFWDTTTSGLTTSAVGTGLSTAAFQDTETFMEQAAAMGWDFANVWAPSSGGQHPLNYTTSAVIYAVTDDLTLNTNETATTIPTGTIFGGPSVYVFDDPGDSLNPESVFASLNYDSTDVGTRSFVLGSQSVNSANGVAYQIVLKSGVVTVTPAPVVVEPTEETAPPASPIIPAFDLPNPKDEIVMTDVLGDSATGRTLKLTRAKQTLGRTEDISLALTIAADACSQSNEDVSRYLSCLTDALEAFANELDAIATDLPPGMENVAQIVQTARAEIDQARRRAQSRLAGATTNAERSAIRRDALTESSAALATAGNEIRKAISLVRADDPELASIQRETIVTVASAIDTVGIQLTRVVGL